MRAEMKTSRLKVPVGLQTRAAFEPATFNDEAGTVEITWTTGARGRRLSLGGPYYEELEVSDKAVDLSRLNNGAPLLDTHNMYGGVRAVLGVVERAWIVGHQGRALVRFSEREDVKPIKADVKNGILRHSSVGYDVGKYAKVEEVDGVPVYRAVKWTPAEISLVPVGFDDKAVVRGKEEPEFQEVEIESHRAAEERQEKNMAETEVTPGAAGADPTERLVAEAREHNARAAEANAASSARAAEEAAAAERVRIAEITKLVRMTKLGEAFADKLVRSSATVDKVREIVLAELARADEESPISSHLRFEAGDDAREKFVRGGVASILVRSGHADTVEAAKSNKRVGKYLSDASTDPGEFGGMRIADLARAALERRGVSTRGLHGERLIQRALEYRTDGGFNSTSDFAVLLETAVNKIFLGRYATIPVSWPQWCAKKSVQDFRTSTFYRPGSFGTLDSVTEAGEIKHKNIPDGAKATLTPATKANIIGISRRAMVNDDLGAFRDLAAGLGEAAARTVEADAWALITAASGLGANAPDGVALFNAAHANIGTTGVMSVATLDSIRAKMALQKDPSSAAFLALRPSILLVPVELGGTAKMFNTSTGNPTDAKNANVANQVLNLFPGGIIDSPYLSAVSSTRVYGLADPNLGPVFAVGFIDGREAPEMKTEESFAYDGVQIRVILDYGTAVIDHRGAVTCAGQ